MGADAMFKKFTAHTCQGDRPILFRQVTVAFFVDWGHDTFGPYKWQFYCFQTLITNGSQSRCKFIIKLF